MTNSEIAALVEVLIEEGHQLNPQDFGSDDIERLSAKVSKKLVGNQDHKKEKAISVLEEDIYHNGINELQWAYGLLKEVSLTNPRTEIGDIEGIDFLGDVDTYQTVGDYLRKIEY